MGTTKSGWCLRAPYNEWTKDRHDLCPKNFTGHSCTCDCPHLGEKPEGWNNGYAVVGPTEQAVIDKNKKEVPVVLDKPTQPVYAKSTTQPRVAAKGGTEALQAMYQ